MSALGKRSLYDGKHAIHTVHNIIVPETQHTITFRFQPTRSFHVLLLVHCMLSAIKLDDQLSLQADEVHDIAANRMLAPKFVPRHLAAA